jgi:hypothetical protein
VRLSLPLRELEEVERPLDVDVMSRHRGEFGPRRQQRGEMKDELDLELRQDAIEHVGVGNRAGEDAGHIRHQPGIERRDVEGDDRRAGRPEASDEAVTDFAAGAGNQGDRFPHRPALILE